MTKDQISRILAFWILVILCTAILVVVSDFILQWHLKIPARFVRQIIEYNTNVLPSKRIKANMDATFVGAYHEFRFHVSTTPEGFRRTAPFELNDHTEPRIILLGDSQTFGIGVNDDETISSFLSLLVGTAVLNTGCSGYNNIEQYQLAQTLVKKFIPDLYILFFFPGNDPYENFVNQHQFLHPQLEDKTIRKAKESKNITIATAKDFLIRHSAIYNLLIRVRQIPSVNKWLFKLGLLNHETPNELVVFQRSPHLKKSQYWAITESVFVELNKLIRQHGSQLIIVIIPDKIQIDQSFWGKWVRKYELEEQAFDLLEPNRHLERFCSLHKIELLDTTQEMMREAHKGKKLYWSLDHHLTAQGNKIIAETLKTYLDDAAHLKANGSS